MHKKSKIIKEQTFSNQNGNLKRLPSDFYYDEFIFDDYGVQNLGGKLRIYAKVEQDKSLDTFSTQIKSQNPELLIKMLTLKEALPREIFESPTKILICDEHINNDAIALIIKWCKSYGFPFAVDIQSEHNPAKKTSKSLFSTLSQTKHISFYVSDFIYNLNEIYSAYHLYRILTGYSDKIIEPIYTTGVNEEKQGITKFIKLSNINIDECKKLFEYKYHKINFQNQISFDNGLHFNVKTRSLFDAAFYQLALLMYDSEKDIRICPICHEYFEPHDPRQIYCDSSYCYPQKAYKRGKAVEKKKKEQSNQ